MKANDSVRPGQLWADNDKRCPGRRLRIDSVDETHATAYGFSILGDKAHRGGRMVRVRLDRFKPTSTGYRLVEHSPGQPVAP